MLAGMADVNALNDGNSGVLKRYVIVGGGIAGVSCAEELHQLDPTADIHVISSSPLIKTVTNFKQVSRAVEEFEVKEQNIAYLTQICPNVHVQNMAVTTFHPKSKLLLLADSTTITYDKLCICTGAVPKIIVKDHPRVLGIRDTESVKEFQKKLADARRIVVVGNGGIATELVYEVSGCEVVWAIKDQFIGHTFFDAGAATFFLPHLSMPHHSASTPHPSTPHPSTSTSELAAGNLTVVQPLKRTKYMMDSIAKENPSVLSESPSSNVTSSVHPGEIYLSPSISPTKPEYCAVGSALGPDWHTELRMKGGGFDETLQHSNLLSLCASVVSVLAPSCFGSHP